MSMTQAAQAGSEAAQRSKTLQTEVLRRFMSEREMTAFLASYRNNLKNVREVNRKANLEKELSKEEKEMVETYLRETDTPIKELAKIFGLKEHTFHYRVSQLALRIVYQNQR